MLKKIKKIVILLILFITFLAITTFLLVRPINAYIESPGDAIDIRSYMKVNGQVDTSKGNLRLVSVYLSPANGFDYLLAKFSNGKYSIEPISQIQGDTSDEDYAKIANYQLNSSIFAAQEVAFKKAGLQDKIKVTYKGIYVANVASYSNFYNKLELGDTIIKIDDNHFDSSEGFQNYLTKLKKGQKIKVTIIRDGKNKVFYGKTVLLKGTKDKKYPSGRIGVGISLVDDLQITTIPKVSVNAGNLGGSSGGLMLTLQLYSQLTNKDVKQSRNIAGTGTIDSNGNVGEIGGIDKKIIAAQQKNVKIFFAPYVSPTKENLKNDGGSTNYQMALKAQKKFAPNMKIIPVRTFDDALNYLLNGTIIKTK
jgi:PDZ domain-containing protein